ncbi:MAG: ImmA/IrrE family metallo-endopeptidase [Xenococcaceae cyanobacterium]
MTQIQLKMASLYERLSELGFSRPFIRHKALPEWWDEEMEATPGAEVEAAAYISRRLNLDVLSLLKPGGTANLKPSCQAKFKTKQGTTTNQLFVAQCMAARIGEMVAYACTQQMKTLPTSAQVVWDEILKTQGFVNLEGLLNWCWSYGLPVVHFDGFPKAKGLHKFHGMAAYFYNRPVIIIGLKDRLSARLLFILAHELGHISQGHVKGTVLVDEDVLQEDLDLEEMEANQFATELLLGQPDMMYYTFQKLTGEKLASYAQYISERDKVDPGVVILNYAWFQANFIKTESENPIIWATANKALKIIDKNSDAPKLINSYTRQYLDLERLDEDSQEYLELVMGG